MNPSHPARHILRGLLRGLAACTLIWLSGTAAALAQGTPVRILVGFPAGGSTDLIARTLAAGLQAELGRTVVVENRPGAGGQIAAQALKAARADGATLFLSNSHALSIIPLTLANPGYDPARDFAPVGLVAINPDVFVINTAVTGNASGLRAFAEWSKANPAGANVGVPAPGSAPEFAVSVLNSAFQSQLKAVPYWGDAPIIQDLLGGQIAAGIGGVGTVLPHLADGRLRIVAVNGNRRLPSLPDVPTYAELGVQNLDEMIFTGLFAPAGTPADLIQQYNAALGKVVRSTAFSERIHSLAVVPATSTPAELSQRVGASLKAYAGLLQAAGFKPQ